MTDSPQPILHVADQAALDIAGDTYVCESLQQEGFIHCCTESQLAGVLERYYSDATGLQLMRINPQQLNAKVVFENTVGGEELFPHVYGAINMSAVVSIEALA